MVQGNFRQEEISQAWQNLLASGLGHVYLTVSFKLHCQSGTYIRALAKHLGDKLGSGAVLLNLVRERVGDYSIYDSEPVI